jgi:hypothetical protein
MFFIYFRVFARLLSLQWQRCWRNKWAMQATRLPLQLTGITDPGYSTQS